MKKTDLEKKLISKELKRFISNELKAHNITEKHGILTGAFLTQTIRKFLNKPLANKINDIDIFILETSKDPDLTETILGDNKSALLMSYSSFFELEKDNTYYIICSERIGLLNKTYVKKPKSNYLNNAFPRQLIESFDINSVRVSYDLKTEKIYYCKHFLDYLQNNQLEIINYKSPISSLIRIVDKHLNNEGHFDLDESIIASRLIIHKKGNHSYITLSDNLKKKMENVLLQQILSKHLHYTVEANRVEWIFPEENTNSQIDLIPMKLVNRVTVYWISKLILKKVKDHIVNKFFANLEEDNQKELFNFYLLKSFAIEKRASLDDEILINNIILLDEWTKLSSHNFFMEKVFFYTTSIKNIFKIYTTVSGVSDQSRIHGLVETGKIKIIDLYDPKILHKKLESLNVEVNVSLNHPDVKGTNFTLVHLNTLAKCQSEAEFMQNSISALGYGLKEYKEQYHYLYHLKLDNIDYSLKLEIKPFSSLIRLIEIKKKRNEVVPSEHIMFIRRLINRKLRYRMILRHVLNAIFKPSLFLKFK